MIPIKIDIKIVSNFGVSILELFSCFGGVVGFLFGTMKSVGDIPDSFSQWDTGKIYKLLYAKNVIFTAIQNEWKTFYTPNRLAWIVVKKLWAEELGVSKFVKTIRRN
jgi:hypothetical protein